MHSSSKTAVEDVERVAVLHAYNAAVHEDVAADLRRAARWAKLGAARHPDARRLNRLAGLEVRVIEA